jgi:hypothetical protein
LQIKTKNVSCHTADSKPVKQEANGTVILPLLVFPVASLADEIVLWALIHKTSFSELFNNLISFENGFSKTFRKKIS